MAVVVIHGYFGSSFIPPIANDILKLYHLRSLIQFIRYTFHLERAAFCDCEHSNAWINTKVHINKDVMETFLTHEHYG